MSEAAEYSSSPLPPRERPETVAEAKARILAHGEKTSAELDAMAERLRADVRRSLRWLPLAAIGAGVLFGGGGRGRRRRREDEDAVETDSGESGGRRRRWQDAAGWAVKFATPIVMEAVSRMGDRVTSRGRRD